MKAMILAAGCGTRLRPVTNELPKALVRIGNRTLIDLTISRLLYFGFNEIIINVHHFARQVINFVGKNNGFGADITFSDESDHLLDTGGGLKKAAWYFQDGEPFLLTNVDLLTNIDLCHFYNFHLKTGGLASLAVQNRDSSRKLLFSTGNELIGWEDRKTGARSITREVTVFKVLSFNGMHIIDPSIYRLISEEGRFSIVELYLRLSAKERITGYTADYFWMDAGKPADLEKAEQLFCNDDTPDLFPGLFR